MQLSKRNGCVQVIFEIKAANKFDKIVDCVNFAKELDYNVIQMKSDAGFLADKDFDAKLIVVSGLTELVVPIYHYQSKVHDSIIGLAGSLQKTLKGIKNVILFSEQNKPYFNVSVSVVLPVNQLNYYNLNSIIKFLIGFGIKQIFIVNNKSAQLKNINEYLTKINLQLFKNKILLFFVGFTDLPEDFEIYSYELFWKK